MSHVCVVHLVRAANGAEPLERFLDSYGKHRAGMAHELVMVLKGFADGVLGSSYEALLNRVAHRRLFVGDWGYDITAYFHTARMLSCDRLLFFNSFTCVGADDWLAKYDVLARQPGVGLVGATGSYQGPPRDRRTLPAPVQAFLKRSTWRRLIFRLPFMEALNVLRWRLLYSDTLFPNPHVRSNAFMIPRSLMLKLQPQVTLTKKQAYRFESSSRSMTRQVISHGLRALVVGRDGRGYELPEWWRSGTFWQGEQENLLIEDNQTRNYQNANASLRSVLNWYAWGAEPESTGRELGLTT